MSRTVLRLSLLQTLPALSSARNRFYRLYELVIVLCGYVRTFPEEHILTELDHLDAEASRDRLSALAKSA
jgi:hypothetical protein